MAQDLDKAPSSYEERLSDHIDDYIQSVIDSPAVRLNEFLQLKEFAALPAASRLLEVPAEGTMLELAYPDAIVERADFIKLGVPQYADNVMLTNWDFIDIPRLAYDGVLAVVPFHHAVPDEKKRYVAGAWEALKPGGVLALGEVEAGSSVHRFLDGFIDDHTFTGHRGSYPDRNFVHVLEAQGFRHVTTQIRSCPWVFDSEESLHAYMTRLFGLKPMSVNALVDALAQCLGLQVHDDRILVNWSLRYFRGVK